MEIKNSIEKIELVEWENLEWLQNKNLKELTVTLMEKLKKSLIENGFMMAFHIWDNGKKKYILDGHHRKSILNDLKKDGYEVPNELPAVFVGCKNRKEAIKKVLIFSSLYAKVTDEGLYELLETENLKITDISLVVDLPGLDMECFKIGYLNGVEEGTVNNIVDGLMDNTNESEKTDKIRKCPSCGYDLSGFQIDVN